MFSRIIDTVSSLRLRTEPKSKVLCTLYETSTLTEDGQERVQVVNMEEV